jgi:glycosyltransferase involved in cell wall biosynthesis
MTSAIAHNNTDLAASRITVVIPAYNAEQTIARAVESCLKQTVPPACILVVDDGSTDRTASVVGELAENYSVVEHLLQQNSGPSVARNNGVEHSRTEWVAFLDSDDEMLPDCLEKQLVRLKQDHADLCLGLWQRVGPDG